MRPIGFQRSPCGGVTGRAPDGEIAGFLGVCMAASCLSSAWRGLSGSGAEPTTPSCCLRSKPASDFDSAAAFAELGLKGEQLCFSL